MGTALSLFQRIKGTPLSPMFWLIKPLYYKVLEPEICKMSLRLIVENKLPGPPSAECKYSLLRDGGRVGNNRTTCLEKGAGYNNRLPYNSHVNCLLAD